MIYTTLPVAQLCKNQVIALGRQMENNYRQIIFDVSDFDEPVTSLMLVHQRKGDAAPYIVGNVTGTQFAWTITDTDTAYAGYGKGELRINFANGLAKSIVFTTMVVKSITGDTQIPSPLQSWYDALIDYIDEHAATPEQIEAAVEAYLDEHPIPAPVTSVNAKTGAVVLTATDVGAMPSSYTAPVTSVNTKTGDVVLDASDVGAYEKPNAGIPKTDLDSAVQTSLGKADTALQTAPVTSVNGQTGVVTLSIPTVPTNVSAFTNDAGYLTQHQSLAAYQTKAITDTGGYFTTDTVEGALQEIGAEIAGINTLIGTGVIS